jgi:hypothetical protein
VFPGVTGPKFNDDGMTSMDGDGVGGGGEVDSSSPLHPMKANITSIKKRIKILDKDLSFIFHPSFFSFLPGIVPVCFYVLIGWACTIL